MLLHITNSIFDAVVLCSKEWWWLMLVGVVEPDSGWGG